jgi:signal recognition particle subunit SRP54
MFDQLQSKFEGLFEKLGRKTKITEQDIDETVKEVRLALLEADVNFQVVKDICSIIAEKAKGVEVLKSISPSQQIIKIVHDELVIHVGKGAEPLNFNVSPPAVFLLVGLQGAGKTTTAAKLALLLRKEYKKTPLLVPADVYRPAAIEQLKTLGKELQIEVFDSTKDDKPVQIAQQALTFARNKLFDIVIIDTAGRLQIDNALMNELTEISAEVNPVETLLVADAMTGQEAVNVAKGFAESINLTGLILTKLDGDARGGAALSIRSVVNKPIKLVGVGEKPHNLEVFHPERMATRILGMGDVVSLVEKVQKQVSEDEALALTKKLKKNTFSLEDFLSQLKMIQKMGSFQSILGMVPGMGSMMKEVDFDKAEKEFKRIEAIILSMTLEERRNHSIIDGNRRKRIAKGSGTSVQEINKLLKQFLEMKSMMSQFAKGGLGGLMSKLGGKGAPPGLFKR